LMLSRTNPSPSCPSTLSRTSQGTPRSSSLYACAAISRGRSARVCHTNICPAAPSLLALRLTDNKTRPFAEVDLTTLLSRQANASSCHRVGFSRTSMGLYARLYLHIRAAIPCPGLVLCPRLLGKMSDNAVAWLPDLVSAASRPHFIDESTVNFNKRDEHYGP
jgi:hypothetical protein